MATSPTLLFLVTEDWYFVSHRLPLAERAVAAGYRVVVATRVQTHGGVIAGGGCELRPLSWRRSGNGPLEHWRAFQEIVALYREVRPDLVHHVALKPVVVGSEAARRVGIRAVVNAVAGLGFVFTASTPKARLIRPALRGLLRRAFRHPNQRVIVQNRDDLEVLVGTGLVPRDRAALIRGAGVDAVEFAPRGERSVPPIVILAGRMLWAKGVAEFVLAANRMQELGLAARFVLVGVPDTDATGAVPQAQLEAWRMEGAVEWWGQRADMAAILAQASIFCLPSGYGEGIPKALLEAGAAGLAIVTTDIPGCREMVQDGESGLLVPPGDQAGLERALQRLLTDSALRLRLGATARARVLSEFSLARVVAETLRVYEELLRTCASS